MTNLIIVLSNCLARQPNGSFIGMTIMAAFLAATPLIFSESPPALQPSVHLSDLRLQKSMPIAVIFIMLPPILISEIPARHLNATLFHRIDEARDFDNRGLYLSCEAARFQSRIIRPPQKPQAKRQHFKSICQHILESPEL